MKTNASVRTPGGFGGFSRKALDFLRDLAKHNERTWFVPRKEIYEVELLEPLRLLVADATTALRKAKIPIGGDPRRSAFRIYRDIRFSRDKSPYKTNLGAYLSRGGDHAGAGGLYIHIQPKNSFMAIGFYQLDKPLLQRWREAMASEPKAFEGVLRRLERNDLSVTEGEDQLKRMPRGFEAHAQSPLAKYFLRHSFMASENLTDADVSSAGLIERMVSLAKRAKPLLDYGWDLEVTSSQS
jgi:uncharacterized protein (TIGR02453 family)